MTYDLISAMRMAFRRLTHQHHNQPAAKAAHQEPQMKKPSNAKQTPGQAQLERLLAVLNANRDNIGSIVVSVNPRSGRAFDMAARESDDGEPTSEHGFCSAIDVDQVPSHDDGVFGVHVTTLTKGLTMDLLGGVFRGRPNFFG